MTAPAAGASHVDGPILSIWAHPDDESYLAAGVMAAAVRAGQRVVCVTATRGELGSTDPERWPPGAALAAVRTAELEQAMAHLGVTEHHWLDYPDGGCADVDPVEGTTRVRELLDQVRPATVLTFGPDGQTGHPDHICVSRWVGLAVDRLPPDRRPRVLHSRPSAEWLARWRPELEALGVFMGNEPASAPLADMALHVELTGELREAKLAALLAQVSQTGPMLAAFGVDRYREAIGEETYVERGR